MLYYKPRNKKERKYVVFASNTSYKINMELITINGIQYYSFNGLEDIKKQMFKLLCMIDKICRENNINYFLDGGTAIGALRHGGFIPWDDDLDISMLKPDYLKLISILKNMDKRQYFLFDYDLNTHCCSFFGEKIGLFSSENGRKTGIYPIKIDIRPLNVINNSEDELKKNRVFRELANYLIFGKCDNNYKDRINSLYKQFDSSRRKFFKYYNYEYGIEDVNGDVILVHPYMEYSTGKTYSLNDIFPLREIEFEGLKTLIPVSDKMLTDIYVQYMTLPKIDNRKPEASKIFISDKNVNILYKYLIDKSRRRVFNKLMFNICVNSLVKEVI